MQMSHSGHLAQLMGSTPHHHHHHHHMAAAAAAASGGSPVAAPGAGAGASTPSAMGGGANAPCSTLFVANLGQFVSEQELKELFGRYRLIGCIKCLETDVGIFYRLAAFSINAFVFIISFCGTTVSPATVACACTTKVVLL